MSGGRNIVAGMLVGLVFGALLGVTIAPALTLVAIVLAAFGALPEAWPVAPGVSWLARCGLAALWGLQLGGVLGMLFGLLDTACLPRRSAPGRAR